MSGERVPSSAPSGARAPRTSAWRDALLGAALVGLALLPLALRSNEPHVVIDRRVAVALVLAGLAVHALPLGMWLASRPGLGAKSALLPPAAWALVLAWAKSQSGLATPGTALLLALGLYALGLGLGLALGPTRAQSGAGLSLLAAALLVVLPARGGLADQAPPVSFARRALVLSPATWMFESAGWDWMRHASVYEPLASDRFEREPIDGTLAAGLAIVLGCLALAVGIRRARRSA